MGCLNSNGTFEHWFGNIHLSGPCNRSCYFCIGQHMMALDSLNNLDEWPLRSIEQFVDECLEQQVSEINVTGSNTDPLLYKHTDKLRAYLEQRIPALVLGIRTNGVLAVQRPDIWQLYDKGSLTVCSLDADIYRQMMGSGSPPDIAGILKQSDHWVSPLKVNVVLGPENVATGDVLRTLDRLAELGVKRVNLREPYGQPHVGDPLAAAGYAASKERLGMPVYDWGGVDVTIWDVHWVEVESVNLYANGRVSKTYPITKGHDELTGKVVPQRFFPGGRVHEQWLSLKAPPAVLK